MAMIVPSGIATSSATAELTSVPESSTMMPKVGVVEQRRPLRVGEEIENRHVAKNTTIRRPGCRRCPAS
jgi:hypothetical protein